MKVVRELSDDKICSLGNLFKCMAQWRGYLLEEMQRVTVVTYTDITQRRRLEIHCQPRRRPRERRKRLEVTVRRKLT
ncbi:hypothetical protein PUN28_016173 [Cardiocondyla obscurior]|uniref:Uncharacterized protein n=1 Tax=Cardiocondyla obscurior TaxID=286306 RepID=A0AAW2ER99_9HYME